MVQSTASPIARLPLRPLIFIPIYIGLACGPSYEMSGAPTFGLPVALLSVAAAMILHFAWAWQAMIVASNQAPTLGAGRRAFLRVLPIVVIVLVALVVVVATAWATLNETSAAKSMADAATPWLSVATILSFFALIWASARTLCDAEAGARAPAHAVMGTFLQMFYIVVGAVFLYRRLKSLADLSNRMIANPI